MLKKELIQLITQSLDTIGLKSDSVSVTTPANESFGDYSCSIALQLSKTLKKNPIEVAENIVKQLPDSEIVEKVEIVKPGFINFWLSNNSLIKEVSNIPHKGSSYGTSDIHKNQNVIVEFSSPNIAKPFTVGHLRSTIIGNAISNLLEATGYNVFKDNHVGDWGTQFGKQIYALKHFGKGSLEKNIEAIENSENPVKELVALYVEFHEKAEHNEELEEEGRKWFKKLEDGDKEARELWQKCVDWSWKEFEKIYKRLGVSFTENNGRGYGESFFEDKMEEVLNELQSHKCYKESKGAKLVFFPEDKYPPLMVLKQDGATLYSTRDLATDKFRLSNPKYGANVTIINEVGAEQSLYFQQLFETEQMLGWVKEDQRVHVKHGLYRFKDTKMSTRKGNTIWLADVLDEAVMQASKLAKDSKESTTNVSEEVAIGALKWNDLKRSSHLDIVFDWEEILNMQGNSGPYMQYTYVRCNSVLQNAGELNTDSIEDIEFNEEERSLLSTLTKYPEAVTSAAENYSPHIVANYLFDLAQKFNLFYQKHSILKADEPTKQLRLLITQSTGQIMKNGLNLLGIQTVEKM